MTGIENSSIQSGSIEFEKEESMKILVTYMSETGNTEKVAEAIFNSLPDVKELRKIADVESLGGYDFVFVGCPIHFAKPPVEVVNFLQAKARGRSLALFVTHGLPEDANTAILNECTVATQDAKLIGLLSCQGELSPRVIDFLSKSDKASYREFANYGPMTIGQPDETRLARARTFARETIEKFSQ